MGQATAAKPGLVRVGLVLVAALALATVSLGGSGARVAAASDPGVSSFHGSMGPYAIAAGPDGALWYVGSSHSVGRMTTSGSASEFPVSSVGPYGITAGPDGALWFTDYFGSSIGRITTTGEVSQYPIPSGGAPFAITAGPDGALWFTNLFGGPGGVNGTIGRITTDGTVTTFSDPAISHPEGIAAGPDGALWFTDYFGSSIGRITTDGAVSTFTGPDIGGPTGITAGPDGALWFTNLDGHSVGRITTSGATSSFYVGPGASNLNSITAGPDGAMWFVWSRGTSMIGRITTDGEITTYTDRADQDATSIAVGSDGALWFANEGSGSIGRVDPSVPGAPLVASILPAGGLLTTDTGLTGPTPGDPLQTTLVSPSSGGAEISQPLDVSQPLPAGVPVLPAQDDIQAPPAMVSVPLRLRFSFDATLLQTTGATASTVAVFRDGVQVGECTNPAVVAATPDPCVYSRTSLPGGDAEVDVYSSHASHWNFGRQAAPPPPTTFAITTASLPSGTIGHAYSATLQAANGTSPYKWKKIGKLPKGLKLQAKTGVISGTPKVSGTFTVQVQVSDSKKPKPKRVATKTFTLHVI